MWDLQEDEPAEIGPFRLISRLGSGGMGTVYLAVQDGQDGQDGPVAVKTIRSEFAQEEGFRRRFTREAEAASSVRSSYTVRVKSFDTYAREPWIATEYVEGLSLRDHVRSRGSLSLPAAVDFALGLTFGLASIHKVGLVHRDLKPGNVLLTDGGPKIIDFGLAYATDFTQATHTGMILGTPGYFSPEQVQGKPVSAASDVFSLGAVLTFASSGEHAFKGVTALTAQYHVVHEEPDFSGVPEELRDVVAACMHKDPHMRPPLNSVLAHLTALRSYGYRETSSGYRWPPAGRKREASTSESSTFVHGSLAQSRRGRWSVLAVAGAGLLVAGVAFGPWIAPGHGRSTSSASSPSTSQPSTPELTTAAPSVEDPMTMPPFEEPEPEVPQLDALLSTLTFNSQRGVCVLNGDESSGVGMAVENSSGFAISVTPVASKGYWISASLIHIRSPLPAQGDDQRLVYLKLPKGDQVPLAIPEGKTSWSFRWPDVLKTADLGVPYESYEPAELLGTYTVVVTREVPSVEACGGFRGDPKRSVGSTS
ncbi:serine/threonine-protein kinase [Streptomyces sp. NPDC087901]|uniref:serine/threonine-protein kinase n=1 Tax=Streptomyces sp. NPDC087901 TaxID=3365818 RepID=UPI00383018EB